MSNTVKLTLILFGILLLIGLNLFRYNTPIETTPLAARNISPDQAIPEEKTGTMESVDQLAELKFVQTYSRPLFSEDRRKFVKPPVKKKKPKAKKVAKKAAPATPPPDLKILGITASGGVSKVLIKLKKSPVPKWVSQGEAINGWEVTEIEKDTVKIVKADREISIGLFPEK